MIYSKYFSTITKENGQSKLNPDQFRRMVNIVQAEGIMEGMKKIKELNKTHQYKYNTMIYKQDTGIVN